MRITIPKSQGKQPFYDARKSSWGDIFPHEPKNPSQEKFGPAYVNFARGRDAHQPPKSDRSDRRSYPALAKALRERKSKLRQAREY